LDIGCGSGVGGLSLHAPQCRVILTDINNEALIFAEANAQLNECEKVDVRKSDILKEAPKDVDLLIANPPYMMDRMKRKYRHGGGDYGAEISLNIVKESIEYLKPGASLALYTGSCVVNGEDIFHQHLKQIIPTDLFSFTYEEIDPDVFGEQLTLDQYKDVERIAAIGLVLTRKNM
jgi:methylase of polypeptide subunit release factors